MVSQASAVKKEGKKMDCSDFSILAGVLGFVVGLLVSWASRAAGHPEGEIVDEVIRHLKYLNNVSKLSDPPVQMSREAKIRYLTEMLKKMEKVPNANDK